MADEYYSLEDAIREINIDYNLEPSAPPAGQPAAKQPTAQAGTKGRGVITEAMLDLLPYLTRQDPAKREVQFVPANQGPLIEPTSTSLKAKAGDVAKGTAKALFSEASRNLRLQSEFFQGINETFTPFGLGKKFPMQNTLPPNTNIDELKATAEGTLSTAADLKVLGNTAGTILRWATIDRLLMGTGAVVGGGMRAGSLAARIAKASAPQLARMNKLKRLAPSLKRVRSEKAAEFVGRSVQESVAGILTALTDEIPEGESLMDVSSAMAMHALTMGVGAPAALAGFRGLSKMNKGARRAAELDALRRARDIAKQGESPTALAALSGEPERAAQRAYAKVLARMVRSREKELQAEAAREFAAPLTAQQSRIQRIKEQLTKLEKQAKEDARYLPPGVEDPTAKRRAKLAALLKKEEAHTGTPSTQPAPTAAKPAPAQPTVNVLKVPVGQAIGLDDATRKTWESARTAASYTPETKALGKQLHEYYLRTAQYSKAAELKKKLSSALSPQELGKLEKLERAIKGPESFVAGVDIVRGQAPQEGGVLVALRNPKTGEVVAGDFPTHAQLYAHLEDAGRAMDELTESGFITPEGYASKVTGSNRIIAGVVATSDQTALIDAEHALANKLQNLVFDNPEHPDIPRMLTELEDMRYRLHPGAVNPRNAQAAENLNEVRDDLYRRTVAEAGVSPKGDPLHKDEGGWVRLGSNTSKPLPEPTKAVKRVLNGMKRTAPFFERAMQPALHGAQRLGDLFGFEATLKKLFPQLVDDMRIFKDAALHASAQAVKDLQLILGPLVAEGANPKDFEIFRRIVILEDLIEMASKGKGNPDVPLAELVQHRQELLDLGIDSVHRAVAAHNRAMKGIGQDLVARGKLNADDLLSFYYPHKVLDYTQKMDDLPWIPKQLKSPFRGYLKGRTGSAKDIDGDYLNVMYKHMTKINLDNMVEDFAVANAVKYDLVPQLLKEAGGTRKKVLEELLGLGADGKAKQLLPGMTVDYNGQTYKAWQPTKGFNLYPASTVPESIVNKLIEGALSPEEFGALVAEGKLPKVLAVGRRKRLYLIPEEIANRFDRFRSEGDAFFGADTLSSINNAWKRITLDFAGIPFQVNNFIGDALALFRDDMTAFTKIGEAFEMLRKDPKDLTKAAQQLMKDAVDRGVISGSTTLMRKGGNPVLTAPVLREFQGVRARVAARNPLRMIESFGQGRENLLRLTKFLKDAERIDRGLSAQLTESAILKDLQRYTVGNLDGLDLYSAAAKASRETFVDYGAVSSDFGRLRDLAFPFMTFYVRNGQNWAKYAMKHPDQLTVKVGGPFAMMTYWNNTGERARIEASLPDYKRYSPHIITGFRDNDGRPIIISFTTPIELAAKIAGLDSAPDRVRRLAQGKITLEQAAKEQLKATAMGPVEMAQDLLSPVLQTLREWSTNKDSLTGRPIVSARLQGTPEYTKAHMLNALENMLIPVNQFRRSSDSRTMVESFYTFTKDPLGGATDFVFSGPGGFRRGPDGTRMPYMVTAHDVEAGFRAQAYTEQNQIERQRESWLERLEQAHYLSARTGVPKPLQDEMMRVRKEGGANVLARDWPNRVSGLRVRIETLKRKIAQAELDGNTSARITLNRQLEGLQSIRHLQALRSTPLSIRGTIVAATRQLEEGYSDERDSE